MLNWSNIDHVLLDMDGTLLDLHFDNYFWQQYVCEQYGQRNGMTEQQALEHLTPLFKKHQGSLNWYCTQFWSDQLNLNIASLKQNIEQKVAFLPNVIEFLNQLKSMPVNVIILTNAHPQSINIKDKKTQIRSFVDVTISSHDIGYPKEHQQFWQTVQNDVGFDPQRSVFIDDSQPILKHALAFGIKHCFGIAQPDSTQALIHSKPSDVAPRLNALTDLFDSTEVK